jgi:hypothetical protein
MASHKRDKVGKKKKKKKKKKVDDILFSPEHCASTIQLTQAYQHAVDTLSTNVMSIINKVMSDVTDNQTGSNIMTRTWLVYLFLVSHFIIVKISRSIAQGIVYDRFSKALISILHFAFLKSKTDFALHGWIYNTPDERDVSGFPTACQCHNISVSRPSIGVTAV